MLRSNGQLNESCLAHSPLRAIGLLAQGGIRGEIARALFESLTAPRGGRR